MIKCNSKMNCLCGKCIVECDSYETLGGTIVCDTAEDFDFVKSEILKNCEYAEEQNNKMTNLQGPYN